MSNFNFNPSEHGDMGGGNLLPKGEYEAVISKAEMTPTKAGDGEYIDMEFTVIGGEFENRKLWEKLNVINPNPKAVEIANKALATICRKLNIEQLTNLTQLLNKPIKLIVGIKLDNQYGDKNKIFNYGTARGATTINVPNGNYNNQSQQNNGDFADLNDDSEIIPF